VAALRLRRQTGCMCSCVELNLTYQGNQKAGEKAAKIDGVGKDCLKT